ncbi:MAG: hypothetical protein IAE82_15315 [Opitutaceae bacterium]|nr:hypothetical protein [Opitutaceae bacterium]
MSPVRRLRLASLAAIAALALGGCASYRMGDPASLPFASVYVEPPLNTSTAPQAAALVGTSLGRQLDRTGRVTLAASGAAEATVQVTLVRLTREPTISRTEDTGLARRWRVTLEAEVTLTDRRTGKDYFTRRKVSAFDEVYSDSGLVSAEYQNMPLLASRLAEAIATEITSVW